MRNAAQSQLLASFLQTAGELYPSWADETLDPPHGPMIYTIGVLEYGTGGSILYFTILYHGIPH